VLKLDVEGNRAQVRSVIVRLSYARRHGSFFFFRTHVRNERGCFRHGRWAE